MTKNKGKARDRARKKAKNKQKNDHFERRKRLRARIRKFDDPILTQDCLPVGPDEDISNLIRELKQVLNATDTGVGLAAPQIGYKKKVFAIRPRISSGTITIFINSVIKEEGKERVTRREGCLSYPDFFTAIERPSTVLLEYEDEQRQKHTKKFKEMEACIIFHEHDHTTGVCIVGQEWKKSQQPEQEQENQTAENPTD